MKFLTCQRDCQKYEVSDQSETIKNKRSLTTFGTNIDFYLDLRNYEDSKKLETLKNIRYLIPISDLSGTKVTDQSEKHVSNPSLLHAGAD